MNELQEKLKNAITNNDIVFLEKNKHKYSINQRFEDEDNDTLLLYSISDKDSFAYEYFLQHNADINLTNDENENILHAIIFSGSYSRLFNFLNNYKFDLDLFTNEHVTPLLLSISLGYISMAKLLIEKGANVNIPDIDGITPLHLAAQQKDLDLVIELVNNGADVRKKTMKGNYPLALAINADLDEIAKYLFNIMY